MVKPRSIFMVIIFIDTVFSSEFIEDVNWESHLEFSYWTGLFGEPCKPQQMQVHRDRISISLMTFVSVLINKEACWEAGPSEALNIILMLEESL
jgi:hypothetical protein